MRKHKNRVLFCGFAALSVSMSVFLITSDRVRPVNAATASTSTNPPTTAAAPSSNSAGGISVVVDGLHSPRGLAFGPGNLLYIAEAGDADHAGSIIEVRNSMSQNPVARTIVGDLATTGDEGEFVGADGISVLGRGQGTTIYAIMALSP